MLGRRRARLYPLSRRDPWLRLRGQKSAAQNPAADAAARPGGLLGYRHYADDVVERFVERAVKTA